MTTPDLYAVLRETYHGRPSGRGWVALDECPACGATTSNERDRAVGFSATGWNCFKCGESGNLYKLLELLGTPVERRDYVPRPPDPPPLPRHWQTNPTEYLRRYCEHPARVTEWQRYRALTLDTIARWRLGVGVLPNSPCRHTRLIYPVYANGKIVAFRGRHWGCDCPVDAGKWISCGGSTAALWGRELLRPGAMVFVMEAPPDAMFGMQREPDIVAVAGTAGANTWRKEWTQALVASQPALVVVAYDNDLAGMASGNVRKELLKEWRAEHPNPRQRPPHAGGWRVLKELRGAGLDAVPWDWSPYPARWDMGDVFMSEVDDVCHHGR